MYILVIHDVELPILDATQILAEVLGRSLYDARQTANVASPGPVVVSSYPDEDACQTHAAQLSSQGIPAYMLSDLEVSGANFIARQIELTATELVVYSRAGDELALPYNQVSLLLRGMGVATYQSTTSATERKLSVKKALITGGVLPTKKVTTTQTRSESKRSQFLYVYSNGHVVGLHADEIQYERLGADMKATRMQSFKFVGDELQKRCAQARFDDRLLNRIQQVRLLGPKLAPESFLDLATTILARSLLHSDPKLA